jgi:hypothetical protein
MKKLNAVVLFIFIVLNTFSSCSARADIHLELALCGSYAVPGMFCADLKGGVSNTTVLEKDDYGRIMFTYSAPNMITQETGTALVICQQIDREYVYFYEDICYILQDYDGDAAETLKAQNDWNCPLDYTKVSKRANEISFDLFIVTDSALPYGRVLEAVSGALKTGTDQISELQFIDMDSSGNQLFWCSAAANGGSKSYILLVSCGGDVAVMELQDNVVAADEIADFKAENGWTY